VVGAGAVNVSFEVVAPVNMPAFLKESTNSCGFMVAEPIGSLAIAAGLAERQLISSDIWEQHPCCVIVFRDDFIGRHTDAVHEFTNMLVDSGKYIEENPAKAAEIAVSFLDPAKKIGLQSSILMKVLTEANGITTNDLYPVMEDLDVIQRFMKENMNIGSIIDLEKFVDLRFAKVACKEICAPEGQKVQGEVITTGESAEAVAAEKPKAAPRINLVEKIVAGTREGKYIIFKLAGERYGLPVLDVREIIRMADIRPMPMMPNYMKGVINLRGKVIPIVDLRLKLAMESIAYTDRMCIIVVDVAGHAGSTKVGITIDAVIEVADIKEATIVDTPSFGNRVDTSYITGMAKMTDGVTTLLDIEKVLSNN
jgi:chemotaxis signal transduction protein